MSGTNPEFGRSHRPRGLRYEAQEVQQHPLPDVTPEFLAECESLAAQAIGVVYDSWALQFNDTVPALVAEVRRLEACLEDPDLAEQARISAANCRRVAADLRAEAAESRAADLERQLAHEQTLRREAEERVQRNRAQTQLAAADRLAEAVARYEGLSSYTSTERARTECSNALVATLAAFREVRRG